MTAHDLSEVLQSTEAAGAALFDLDGTLVDSVADIALAVNITLRERNLPEMSISQLDSLMGYPISQILTKAGISLNIDDAVRSFRATLVDVMGMHSTVFPGVLDVLGTMRERGWQLGVATNKPKHLAELALARAGLAALFPVVVGAQTLPPKPDPAIPMAALAELNCSSGLMIGDTTMDIEAGAAAGLMTIGISPRPGVREEMSALGGQLILESMNELLRILG